MSESDEINIQSELFQSHYELLGELSLDELNEVENCLNNMLVIVQKIRKLEESNKEWINYRIV